METTGKKHRLFVNGRKEAFVEKVLHEGKRGTGLSLFHEVKKTNGFKKRGGGHVECSFWTSREREKSKLFSQC